MIHHERRRVADVRVDRVAEHQELEDGRHEHDQARPRVAHELATLLANHLGDVARGGTPHATSLRNRATVATTASDASSVSTRPCGHRISMPTPFRKIALVTVT